MDSTDEVLGLSFAKAKSEPAKDISLSDDVLAKLEARKQARINKDWATSDAIRDELFAQGIVVKDLVGNEYEVTIR